MVSTVFNGAPEGTRRAPPFALACSLTRLCSASPRGFESLAITYKKITECQTALCNFWRRARDSNPRNGFGRLHDFQSCSFDRLGQLSIHIQGTSFEVPCYYNQLTEKNQVFIDIFLFFHCRHVSFMLLLRHNL